MDTVEVPKVEVKTHKAGAKKGPPLMVRGITQFFKIINDLTRRKDFTLNRRLAELFEVKVPAKSKPVKGVSSKDVIVDSKSGVWVRIFTPCDVKKTSNISEKNAGKLPVVVYYHGGGFSVLSPAFFLYDKFCRNLARKKPCVVVSVHYRRSPEHKYPVAHDDSYGILKWLQSEGHMALPPNAEMSFCIIMGDSAGGNIVHHIGCKAAAEDLKPVKICGHVLLQPFFGGEERTPAEVELKNVPLISVESSDWHWKAYLPSEANRDHPVSNVIGPHAADISELALPSSLVVVGSLDTLQDWQLRYAAWLKKGGKQVDILFYEGAMHAFHLFHNHDLAKQVLLDICKFIEGLRQSQ